MVVKEQPSIQRGLLGIESTSAGESLKTIKLFLVAIK